jgi:hypothetical protein
MRKAEGRLDEEMKRVDIYLHDSTRKEVSCREIDICPLADIGASGSLRKDLDRQSQGRYGGRVPETAGPG